MISKKDKKQFIFRHILMSKFFIFGSFFIFGFLLFSGVRPVLAIDGIMNGKTITGETDNFLFWLQTYDSATSPYFFDKFFIDKTGNVGIGLTNPGAKLDISGSLRNSLATTHSLLGNAGNTVVMADNTGTLYNTPLSTFTSANSLWAGSKNGDIWNGDAGAGNVGIGTTAPGKKLDVNGDIQSTGNFISSAGDVYVKSSGGTNTVFRGVRATTAWADAVDTQWFQVGNYSDNVAFTAQSGTAATRMAFITSAFHITTVAGTAAPVGLFDISNGNTKLFNVLSTGSVGIGTTGPDAKLSVVESVSGNKMQSWRNNANGVNLKHWQMTIQSDGRMDWQSVNDAINAVNATPLTLLNSGNVGIGTTNPLIQLHVQGSSPEILLDASSGTLTVGATVYPGLVAVANANGGPTSFLTGAYGGIYNTATTAGSYPFSSAGNLIIQSRGNSDRDINFVTGVTPSSKMTIIGSSGNVGIGLTDPGTKLDISGSLRNSLATTHSLLGNAGNTVVMADNTGTLYNTPLSTFTSANSLWAGSKNGDIWNGDAGAGNVGIGTATPGGKLHIVDDGTNPGFIYQGPGDFQFQLQKNSTKLFSIRNNDVSVVHLNTQNSARLALGVSSGTAGGTVVEAMSIITNGNVGIGTTNPGKKLEVGAVNGNWWVTNDGYIYTYAQAKAVCAAAGARLMTYAEMEAAYKNGANSCNCGWMEDNVAGYVMQDGALGGCGGAVGGIRICSYDLNSTMSAYCANDTIKNNGSMNIAGQVITKGLFVNNGQSGESAYLGFVNNGANTDTVRLGIGTTIPATKLDIAYAQGNGIQMTYDNTQTYRAWIRPFWNSASDSRMDFAVSASGVTPTTIMSLNSLGNVGIGLTNPGTTLDISGTSRNSLATTHSLLGNAGNVVVMADNTGTLYSTPLATFASNITGNYLPLSGGGLTGDLNLGNHDILGVNKLNVTTIDPLYNIKGVNYSTFAASIAGGVKEEYIGRADIKVKSSVGGEREYVIDFDNLERGSDLWVWRQTVDFSENNVEVLITPYGGFAQVYSIIKDNKIIFRADKPIAVHYRLSGRRIDWQKWPTKAIDQQEKASFVIE